MQHVKIHGLDFQQVVGCFVGQQVQRLGDLFEATNDSAGRIARCKVGDFLVILGPDSAAPESCIVFEAKQDRSYTQKDALQQGRNSNLSHFGCGGDLGVRRGSAQRDVGISVSAPRDDDNNGGTRFSLRVEVFFGGVGGSSH